MNNRYILKPDKHGRFIYNDVLYQLRQWEPGLPVWLKVNRAGAVYQVLSGGEPVRFEAVT